MPFGKIDSFDVSSRKWTAYISRGLPVVLSVDSSAYGVGSVLAHRYPDGSERPICYASRTLNDAEKSYSQLDKEALAIFYGVTKNHQYLFGRRFLIRTDHKPLSYIFGDKVGIPQTAASRLQRYAARLAAYDFAVEWVSTTRNGPPDALSRLPLPDPKSSVKSFDSVSYLFYVENEFPISHKDVAEATKRDPILAKIVGYILFGWPRSIDIEEEKPYFHRKDNLFIEHGCIVYNYRVVIPNKLQNYILRELHEGHLGVVKMKCLARNYVYWPGLDKEIENVTRECDACRQQRDNPPHAPLSPWTFPARPWQRLHADFGQYRGKYYLIIVDAHTKWIEAFHLTTTVAKSVISKLADIFSRFGLPLQIVTDNGPPFSSSEVQLYFKKNGIVHTLTSPYRPQGNGAAENAVKTVKKCIKKAVSEGVDVDRAIAKMLFQYRNCEHATTGVAPAMAMFGRLLRGRLDALRPSTERLVHASQTRQTERAGGVTREVAVGDRVLFREYSSLKPKWVEGRVRETIAPASYEIEHGSRSVQRHIDQVINTQVPRKRFSLSRTSGEEASPPIASISAAPVTSSPVQQSLPSPVESGVGVEVVEATPQTRRVLRQRPLKPPSRFIV